ncbi:MAG: NAD-dependent epimerase/dehydratase family protein, partial [Burkholderiales bacterium]|nr:NAD-dependent epimerase/dehydratase family protein [Burkholderiales bacterium]
MKVLVTGANGFVGIALCQRLMAQGMEVAGAVRTAAVRLPSGVSRHVVGDIGGQTDWRSALTACDAVVHLAGRTQTRRESAHETLKTFRAVNVEGTLGLARQAAQAG